MWKDCKQHFTESSDWTHTSRLITEVVEVECQTRFMKLWWLLTTFQSDAASAHWRPSLVSDEHVPVCQFQSVHPSTGAVYMQPAVKLNGALFLWCLTAQTVAADDFCFPMHHSCTRTLLLLVRVNSKFVITDMCFLKANDVIVMILYKWQNDVFHCW